MSKRAKLCVKIGCHCDEFAGSNLNTHSMQVIQKFKILSLVKFFNCSKSKISVGMVPVKLLFSVDGTKENDDARTNEKSA